MAERYNWGFPRVSLVAATAKSIAALSTPSTRRLWIRRWQLTFDGTPNAQAGVAPVKVEFFRGVSLTGAAWSATPPTAVNTDPNGPAALHTPQWNATTEPTSFAAGVYLLPPFDIPPTNGLIVPVAADAYWQIAASSTFVCRVTPGAAGVDVSLALELEE